jgi:hypothetical protein
LSGREQETYFHQRRRVEILELFQLFDALRCRPAQGGTPNDAAGLEACLLQACLVARFVEVDQHVRVCILVPHDV